MPASASVTSARLRPIRSVRASVIMAAYNPFPSPAKGKSGPAHRAPVSLRDAAGLVDRLIGRGKARQRVGIGRDRSAGRRALHGQGLACPEGGNHCGVVVGPGLAALAVELDRGLTLHDEVDVAAVL